MLYRSVYVDGSEELVEADNIRKARAAAQKLYDAPVKSVIVQDVDDMDDDEDEDDDGEDADEDAEEEKEKQKKRRC